MAPHSPRPPRSVVLPICWLLCAISRIIHEMLIKHLIRDALCGTNFFYWPPSAVSGLRLPPIDKAIRAIRAMTVCSVWNCQFLRNLTEPSVPQLIISSLGSVHSLCVPGPLLLGLLCRRMAEAGLLLTTAMCCPDIILQRDVFRIVLVCFPFVVNHGGPAHKNPPPSRRRCPPFFGLSPHRGCWSRRTASSNWATDRLAGSWLYVGGYELEWNRIGDVPSPSENRGSKTQTWVTDWSGSERLTHSAVGRRGHGYVWMVGINQRHSRRAHLMMCWPNDIIIDTRHSHKRSGAARRGIPKIRSEYLTTILPT